MKQEKIFKKTKEIRKRLDKHRKDSKLIENAIILDWKEIMEKCNHPDLQGIKEGYCPDCGYTFG